MLIVNKLLGSFDELKKCDCDIERLYINSSDAVKHRLASKTDAGNNILIDVEPGNYLIHHAVLSHDKSSIVVIEREFEESVIVRLPENIPCKDILKQGARLSHTFGNLHIPIEVEGYEFRAPITTSIDVIKRTVSKLRLPGIEIFFDKVQLGLYSPLFGSSIYHN